MATWTRFAPKRRFCTFRAKTPIHVARMRHDGPGLWFTRYTRSQRIPIIHAPRVDRFYTRPTAVLAAQAPLVTTFATHFLLPKSGLRCKKSGHGSGRAPVTPGLPFRYLHYLHGQLSTFYNGGREGVARAYHTMYGITIVLRVRERSRLVAGVKNP